MNTNEPVSYACQIVEADFEANILKIEMLDEDYSVSAGIKFLSNTHPAKELTDEEIEDEVLKDKYWAWQGNFKYLDFAKAIMKRCNIISGTDK
jgi:hypothetical protein